MQKRKTPKYAFHQIPGGGETPKNMLQLHNKKQRFLSTKKNEMIPLVNGIFLDLTGI